MDHTHCTVSSFNIVIELAETTTPQRGDVFQRRGVGAIIAVGLNQQSVFRADLFNSRNFLNNGLSLDDIVIFVFDENKSDDKVFHHEVKLMDIKTKDVFYDKLETAASLKALGLSTEVIEKATGLSQNEIDKL